jgi:hypothetical protein
MKEIKFYKEQIAIDARFSELLMNNISIQATKTEDDFIKNTLTVRLNAFVMARLNEKKTLTVYRERPTFWEWLTRKPRTFTFEFNCKEVLKNPPVLPPDKSVMIYTVEHICINCGKEIGPLKHECK